MVGIQNALPFLEKNSLFARRWLNAQEQWRVWLEERFNTLIDSVQIDQLLLPLTQRLSSEELDEAVLMNELRRVRQQLMLWIAYRDLNGLASLAEVTTALSYFAEK